VRAGLDTEREGVDTQDADEREETEGQYQSTVLQVIQGVDVLGSCREGGIIFQPDRKRGGTAINFDGLSVFEASSTDGWGQIVIGWQ
jgi:hypothetical protein